MGLFRRGQGRHALAVAMTGVKLGDRLLQVGCTDSSLLAAIAPKVGLSGRACALVTSDEDAERARRGAEHGGVLLELEKGTLDTFPYDDDSFDLILIDNQHGVLSGLKPEQRVIALRAALGTLVPRGRLIVMEHAPRRGLGSLIRGGPRLNPQYESSGGALVALRAEGFRSVRQLAQVDGLSFFEGVR